MLDAIWMAFVYAVAAGVLGVIISLTYMKRCRGQN